MARNTNSLSPIDTTVAPHSALPSRSASRNSSITLVSDSPSPPKQALSREELLAFDFDDAYEDESWWSLFAALRDVLSIKLRNDTLDAEADVRGMGEKYWTNSSHQNNTRRRSSCIGRRPGGRYVKLFLQFLGVLAITSIIYHAVRHSSGVFTLNNISNFNPHPLPQFRPAGSGKEAARNSHHGIHHKDSHSHHEPNHKAASTDTFDHILPVPCHSHNDYNHRTPLYSALRQGCISVEADVWLFGNELFVGHTRKDLEREATLDKLYIQPLLHILDTANTASSNSSTSGIFTSNPTQSLTLLIDFKTSGRETFTAVTAALEPLRSKGYLTHWSGQKRVERPITVVASGAATLADILSPTVTNPSAHRDIFLDAPLDHLADPADPSPPVSSGPAPSLHDLLAYTYNPSNSHYASTKLSAAVGLLGQFSMGETEVRQMQVQIEQARERGLVSRYWGAPNWPTSLRRKTWGILLRERVGVLNVDSFSAVRRLVKDRVSGVDALGSSEDVYEGTDDDRD